MLIDEARITIRAGHGGTGRSSFFAGKKSGPDGGNGGRGGSVYIAIDSQMYSLNHFSKQKLFKAENGMPGQGFVKEGKDGEDMTIYVPQGTAIEDSETGIVVELTKENTPMLVARGGRGGRGNTSFKSSTNTAPRQLTDGKPGQERVFRLILRLIADYGLIGLPNAGKSSLLNELTAAQAKVANYPFTTLEPNLGVINGKVIADIPGLIEGASTGKGLGIRFLKHVEKVQLLLHCIPSDSNDLLRDYEIIRKELGQFNLELLKKKEIILLTKIDMIDRIEVEKKIKVLETLQKQIIPVSIHDFDSLELLKKSLH